VAERGRLLNAHFTHGLYVNVCRSLFERHKLLFSFILATKMLQHEGAVDAHEWRFLLAGPTSSGGSTAGDAADAADAGHRPAGRGANPAPDWLTDKAWGELVGLSELPSFSGLTQHMAANLACYKALFDSSEVCVCAHV
jgi:dynein heavy chain